MKKMFKQILIAIVLTLLLAEQSWDVEAHERTKALDSHPPSYVNVRVKRFSNPFTFIANVWNALTDIYGIYSEVSCFRYSIFFPRVTRYFNI